MAMDDTCAVCADTLEWVAYGACGHKDVCSTCVVRLRLVCNDRRCCICKTESNFIFLTKALGDYTRTISDFSLFPSEPKEGRMGEFWYHEDTQAFFDDSDHYKMIKAMCRLSCSVCDSKLEVQPNDGPRRRPRLFRNIDQLKGHMFHQHKLVMCSLCLEGRKVFICEQKLYTRSQLNQHINTGDSEVDGSESERGGFTGHPKCEFCLKPFYGDNELYLHMSTEHYTCHICQRQHPGQYEYYKNYDDLELHFRRDHFLCEDEACLAKKFIVFPSETELKRHNTLEHAGRMSRSQRNAALQIPTSFRYRRNNERENRRGRGREFQRDGSENDLSMAIQASFEAANLDGRVTDVSSSAQTTSNLHEELDFDDPLIPPYESEHTTNSDPPSRYLQALSASARNGPIQEASFPPLPISIGNNQPRSYENALAKKKMAGQFRVRVMNKKAPVLALGRPSSSNAPAPAPLTVSPQHTWPTLSGASGPASGSGESKMSIESGPSLSGYSSSVNARSAFVHESTSSGSHSQSSTSVNAWPALSNSAGSASVSGPIKQATENGSALSAYSASLKGKAAMHESSGSSFYSSSKSNTRKISHSASAPNLAGDGSFNSSAADFPPVSAAQLRKVPAVNSVIPVEDVHTANKSLVERIRTALNFDEDKYNDFKVISGEYRNGTIDAVSYLVSVEQFGLSHLLLEMARLLPDTEKQKELIDTYTANIVSDTPTESERMGGAFPLKLGNSSSTKGKKSSNNGNNTSREILADNVLSTVRKLQSNYKPSDEEVEVLSKDGYRNAKGKSKVVTDASSQGGSGKTGGGSNQNIRDSDVSNKQQHKKTSKFHRLRLGENSPAAILDLRSKPDQDPGVKDAAAASDEQNPTEVLPARGVWRNGGGQKLLSRTGK